MSHHETFILAEMEPGCDCLRRVCFDTSRDELREFLTLVSDGRVVVLDGGDRVGRSTYCDGHGEAP